MTRIASTAAILLSLASLALAGEVAGVRMPDTVTVEGKTLALNGMGLRTRVVFKVYVASLYLEKAPDHDPASVVKSDQVKRVEMAMRSRITARVSRSPGISA